MQFLETRIPGVLVVETEAFSDQRGVFARTFCSEEFERRGLCPRIVQCGMASNYTAGTIRGLHYQVPPRAETKLVRCTAGEIFDVVVDLRPGSPTYLQHVAVRLSAANRRALYVPELCAHGYQVLVDETDVSYQMSEHHAPECEQGLRYDDPLLAIEWPLPVTVISDRDTRWSLCQTAASHPG